MKFWKNEFKDLPNWNDIISDLDYNIKNKNEVKILPNLGFVTYNGHRIEKVENIRKKIHYLNKDKPICTAHIYISLLSNSHTFGKHKDDTDVYFVLAIGKMKWIVEYENGEEEYEMSAGDMIYLPKDRYHTPVPLSPRVGISIGFN